MIIGVPRESFTDERRISLGPAGVRALREQGATVYIEHDAGYAAGWKDAEFEQAGATIAFNAEEVFTRADLILKVLPPSTAEAKLFREDQTLMSYLQLPMAPREVFDCFTEQKMTAIGLENIQNERGHPVRRATSEIAGTLAVHNAVNYLHADEGGRGILMSGTPGVPPASVGIIGAGVVGMAAAEAAINLGAHVILVDQYVFPLRSAIKHHGKSLQTAISNEYNLEKLCKFVDVLIGAVLVEDLPTPHMLTRKMIRSMKHKAVFIDVTIDQGGISETSRPTTISDPVYVDEGVIHFAVPNMAAQVPRTSTRAFQNHVIPLIRYIIKHGTKKALAKHPWMSTGLNMFEGKVTRKAIAKAFDTELYTKEDVLK